MPTLKLTVYEPINIIIGEKTYTIETLSSDMVDRFMTAARAVGTDPETVNVKELANVLAEVLPGISREEAAKVDIRYIIKIAEFLAEQINSPAEPGEGKN